jgi:hypothetical protein
MVLRVLTPSNCVLIPTLLVTMYMATRCIKTEGHNQLFYDCENLKSKFSFFVLTCTVVWQNVMPMCQIQNDSARHSAAQKLNQNLSIISFKYQNYVLTFT